MAGRDIFEQYGYVPDAEVVDKRYASVADFGAWITLHF